LYAEIALEPKPGLVSFVDVGSHQDMDAGTFMRSLFALRGYFGRITRAGCQGASFTTLQALGREAEARMLAATGGINTHKGVVFCLGLLCASAGRLHAQGLPFSASQLQGVLQDTWGQALTERAQVARVALPTTHGQRAARQWGLRSAAEEAALGFPVLFEVTWPALLHARACGAGDRAARVQALMASMAVLDDTNVAHRGGLAGLHFVQSTARQFLATGGVMQDNWLGYARVVQTALVQRRLSPGGAADMLACACWLDALTCMNQLP
jgi:triphosphoribosyl-dephospho-CoA synthase